MFKATLIFSTIALTSCLSNTSCFKDSFQDGFSGNWVVQIANHAYNEVQFNHDGSGVGSKNGYFEAIVDYDQVPDFKWSINDQMSLQIVWTTKNNEIAKSSLPILHSTCKEITLMDLITEKKIVLKRK